MRKITFLLGLFAVLTAFTPMKAQTYVCEGTPVESIDELTSGYYLMSVVSNGKEGLLYWSDNGYNDYVSATQASAKIGVSLDGSGDDKRYLWHIEKSTDGSFTVQSAYSSKFLAKTGNGSSEGQGNTDRVDAGSANIATFTFNTTVDIMGDGIPHHTVKMVNGTFEGKGTTTFIHCNGSSLGTGGSTATNESHLHLSYWSAGDGDETNAGKSVCKIAFYPVEEVTEINLTYRFHMDGIATTMDQSVTAYTGKDFPNVTPDHCVGTMPEGTVQASDAGTVKDINVTWNGPFEYSAALADAKWYLMTMAKINEDGTNKGALPVMRYTEGATNITLGRTDADVTFTFNKADQWAFVGNPFDGFKIYNRAAEGARLISPTSITSSNEATTYPYVSTDELPSGFTELWDIQTQNWHTEWNQSEIEGAFSVCQHGQPTIIMNRRNGKLAYWIGDSDNGSAFTVSKNLPTITLHTFTDSEGNSNAYASFYVDYPVQIFGPELYTGTVSGNSLELTNVPDYSNIIPGGQGVVLIESWANEDKTYTPIIYNDDAIPTIENNDLTGTTTDLDITNSQANYLVLGRSNETSQKLGFYQPTVTTIPANRAYIDNTAHAVRGLAFNFGGEQTVIQLPTTTPADNQPVYDLSGRRVTKAAKGIYIQGGKKIYVK